VGAADRVNPGLGQADVADLALGDEVGAVPMFLAGLEVDAVARADRLPAGVGVPCAGSAGASAPAPAAKPAYPPPADIPTQEGPNGLRFDFNGGCRVLFPETEHPWRVELRDLDTGNILFQTELKGGRVNSSKRYFVRFRLEVWQQNEKLISHDYSAAKPLA